MPRTPDAMFVVTDGPSLAFVLIRARDVGEAEAEGARIVKASGRSADVMIHDTDDLDDLSDWALTG